MLWNGYFRGVDNEGWKAKERPKRIYQKENTKNKDEGKYSEANIRLAERVNKLHLEASQLISKKDYSDAISNYKQLLNMNCEIAGYRKYDICRKIVQIF